MSVTTVIPCLNEEGSIEECVHHVRNAFKDISQLEILVVDNGSVDSSSQKASHAGAKVINETKRGYGAAILKGLREAKGDFIVIGDADNTYDYEDAAILVKALESGADFAIGDRIHGKIETGAMPWLHQHLGTPALSWALSKIFGCRVHDINCGLRAIRKDCLDKLHLRTPGMEFASEMVIHAQKAGLKIVETPIRYYRRHHGQAKLRTFRDGWRHLRFILLCAPFFVYVVPALLGFSLSFYMSSFQRFGLQVFASLIFLCSTQVLVFGFLAKAIAWVSDSFIVDKKAGTILTRFQLEHGIFLSLALFLFAILFLREWDLTNLIRGATLVSISIQIFFSSFLLSSILLRKNNT